MEYNKISSLASQVQQISDAAELPFAITSEGNGKETHIVITSSDTWNRWDLEPDVDTLMAVSDAACSLADGYDIEGETIKAMRDAGGNAVLESVLEDNRNVVDDLDALSRAVYDYDQHAYGNMDMFAEHLKKQIESDRADKFRDKVREFIEDAKNDSRLADGVAEKILHEEIGAAFVE